jgi:hypothetical protein
MFELESAYLDIDAIEQGKWLPLGADFKGVEIFARGLSSAAAKAMQTKLQREAPKEDRTLGGMLTADAEDRIRKAVIVEKCVTDWRGLSSKGKELPFSKQALASILEEPRARKIAVAIVGAIIDLENTMAKQEAEVVGNSPAS